MQFRLRLAHFYPTLLNLYGDRGNILCLRRRCEARSIALVVDDIGLGDPFSPEQYDLAFIGGGQDREQQRVAGDLQTKGDALRHSVENDMPVLAVCGGYQFLGRSYQPGAGRELPGLGIFDMHSVHPGEQSERCIGNVVADWDGQQIVGFENHGGRTYLGSGTAPLARVVAGFGNNGEDGTEGARYRNAIGTYLHGSLLPKNPVLADTLIGLALDRKYSEHVELAPLDDALEEQAHEDAVTIAIRDHLRASRSRLPFGLGRVFRRPTARQQAAPARITAGRASALRPAAVHIPRTKQ
jgi:CobQ-like glutamine amidotransferase family enzyme